MIRCKITFWALKPHSNPNLKHSNPNFSWDALFPYGILAYHVESQKVWSSPEGVSYTTVFPEIESMTLILLPAWIFPFFVLFFWLFLLLTVDQNIPSLGKNQLHSSKDFGHMIMSKNLNPVVLKITIQTVCMTNHLPLRGLWPQRVHAAIQKIHDGQTFFNGSKPVTLTLLTATQTLHTSLVW